MSTWRITTCSCWSQRRNLPGQLIDFDYRHHLNLSINCSINDHLAYVFMDPVLLSTVLDVSAIKPNATKCSHCKAYDHLVSRCSTQTRLVPRVRPRFVKISTKKNADSGRHASENMSVGYGEVYVIYQVQQHRALP